MNYTLSMQARFEAEKNKKAFLYTITICGVLLLLAFIITFPVLKVVPPIAQDFMEINLGNNEEGFGEKQPLIKGEMNANAAPAPAKQQVNNTQAAAAANEAEPDDNAEADAAPVTKAIKPVKKITPVLTPAVKPVIKKATPAPQTVYTPNPPKAIATYKGPGNGKGNGATEDNGYRYQGTKPGGTGDAGDPSGKPDSYGNTPGGKSGVSVTRGVRPLNLGALRFEDDFNDNAKVYLDIKYNSAGSFVSSTISKGTTTSNNTILSIAKRKAASLKFPPSGEGGLSTILFNFRVQN
jgi:hypothetical protein